MNWYITVLKKYAVFSGRSRRKEYWYFSLFNIIFSIVFGVVDGVIGTLDPSTGFGILGLVYSLAVLLPALGVSVRRLHDTGKTGWWLLIGFVPLIGLIVLLIFFVKSGDEASNDYGENPIPADEAA